MPFSQRSEQLYVTIRMQIDKKINVEDELNKAKQNKLQMVHTGTKANKCIHRRDVIGYIARLNAKCRIVEVPLSACWQHHPSGSVSESREHAQLNHRSS